MDASEIASGASVESKERVGFELPRLQAAQEPALRRLAAALGEVFGGAGDVDDRLWAYRIEMLRRQLLACGEPMGGGEDEGRSVGEICRLASSPPRLGLALLKMVRQFRPGVCLELGTAIGMSAAFQAAGLELNGTGRLLTIEASQSRAALARRNLQSLGLAGRAQVVEGTFDDKLGEVLATCGTVDFAFIDGHHDEHATLRYFERVLGRLSEEAVVVFDDIYWSDGMARAWSALRAHERVRFSVDLARCGVCVTGDGKCGKQHFQVRLY